jgi:ATP synthase regulation protein NCA2
VTQANANKPTQKHYTRYTLLAVAAATATSNAKKHGLLTYERQQQLIELSRSARVGLESFFKEQLLAPAVNIINNVLFRKRVALMDAAAIQDARLSLETMLNDFIRDTEKGVSTAHDERYTYTFTYCFQMSVSVEQLYASVVLCCANVSADRRASCRQLAYTAVLHSC